MKNRSLVSIDDFSTDEILKILDLTEEFEKQPTSRLLEGKVIATLFFEPSTRTRLSFESAMLRLGGRIINVVDAKQSSAAKGETIYDTIKMMEKYSDIIVIRHHADGAVRVAAEATDKPVINAGD